MAADRLAAARERLQAALLAGHDTSLHRKAIALLEGQQAREAERLALEEAALFNGRWAVIHGRAEEILAATSDRLQKAISGVI